MAGVLRCPAGHTLKQTTALRGCCDRCCRRIEPGDNVLDCITCNVYLCQGCAGPIASPACTSPVVVHELKTVFQDAIHACLVTFGNKIDEQLQELRDKVSSLSVCRDEATAHTSMPAEARTGSSRTKRRNLQRKKKNHLVTYSAVQLLRLRPVSEFMETLPSCEPLVPSQLSSVTNFGIDACILENQCSSARTVQSWWRRVKVRSRPLPHSVAGSSTSEAVVGYFSGTSLHDDIERAQVVAGMVYASFRGNMKKYTFKRRSTCAVKEHGMVALLDEPGVRVTKVDVYARGTLAVVTYMRNGTQHCANFEIEDAVAFADLVQMHSLRLYSFPTRMPPD